MDYQQMQEDIKQDLKTIPELKVGILPARTVYGTTLIFSFKCAIAFLLINSATQLILKSVGVFHSAITPGLIVLSFVMAFLASLLLTPLTFNFVLFGKLFAGKLKTEFLFKRKYAQLIRVFLVTYGLAYLLATIFFDSGIGMDDAAREHFGIWLAVFGLVMSQIIAFLVALVISSVIFNTEMQRLGFGVLLEGIGHLIRKARTPHYHNDLS